MRSVSIVLVLVAATVNAAPTSNKPYYDLNDAETFFEYFIQKYNRNYKDEADRDVHYQAFVESLKRINMLNALSTTATFDINQFSDYTPEEIKNLLGLKKPHPL